MMLLLNAPRQVQEPFMKTIGVLPALAALLMLSCAPSAISQGASVAVDNLPNSGTYFIVNAETKEALQPNGASAAQNVFCFEYNSSGMQKWVLKRKIDPKTKKPLNRYTIRFAGENTDLHLQPFPAADHTCMISSGASDFTMAKAGTSFVIKSAALNGDALYTYPNPPAYTEARFGPSDGSQKFQWDFIATE
jgi:hypothetical protein